MAHWIDAEIEADRSGVISCSALKRAYRDVLRRPQVLFVYLSVPQAVLEQRLTSRPRHYMPATLLASQLAALEPPAADEAAIVVDATGGPARTVALIRTSLSEAGAARGSSP